MDSKALVSSLFVVNVGCLLAPRLKTWYISFVISGTILPGIMLIISNVTLGVKLNHLPGVSYVSSGVSFWFLTRVGSRVIIVLIMQDLTQRQIHVLKNLIEEYIDTALPVGSETLEKKHNLSASPATIRNEMVRLTKLGYLKKTHTSSGRVPTPSAMKFYVSQLMKEKELSVVEEVAVKEQLWDCRSKKHDFMKKLTKTLAERTKALAVTVADDDMLYTSGYANILEMPEFYDIDITKNLLSVIDELDYFENLFARIAFDQERTHILLGEELGPRLPPQYGFIFTQYEMPEHGHGTIGVLGPVRLHYTSIVPIVRYFGNLAGEIAREW